MAWYKAGTCSVTNGSTTVTGTGTAWVDNVRIGSDGFVGPDGLLYEILKVVSSTEITLAAAYKGTTASSGGYAIAPIQGYTKELADKAAALIDQFSDAEATAASSASAAASSASAASDSATAAASSASAAKSSADSASASATAASGSASSAKSYADAASASATNAATSEKNASASASAAAASQSAVSADKTQIESDIASAQSAIATARDNAIDAVTKAGGISIVRAVTTLSSDLAAGTSFAVPGYTMGANRLFVYLDGIICQAGSNAQYVEKTSTTITFNDTLPSGLQIEAISFG